MCVCALSSKLFHPPTIIYRHVWHQVSLLHAVPVKLNDVAFQPHWQQQTHACIHTHIHIHNYTNLYTNTKLYTHAWLHITHCYHRLAGMGWTSLRLVEYLMSDCIFLSPAHEKRWCLLTSGCERVCVPQPRLEGMASAPVRGPVRNLQLQWSLGRRGEVVSTFSVFQQGLTVMGRKNEGASEYFLTKKSALQRFDIKHQRARSWKSTQANKQAV